jgi:hypothetical protein
VTLISDLDALRLAPLPADSVTLVSTGEVVAVNPAGGLVQVALRGNRDAVVWLPATAARYRPGGSCRVVHDAQAGGRAVHVQGAVDPWAPSVVGVLQSLGADVAGVNVLGGSAVVPYLPSTYDVGDRVWVSLDDWGRPARVDGPTAQDATSAPTPPPAPGGGGSLVQVTVSISAQWSGSFRSGSGWDRWNTGRYGGRSTLYQGNGFGSGPMVGLAVYGNQLRNLGAVSIDRIAVALRPVGLSGASGPAVVQGSPHAQQPPGAPAGTGSTATEGNGGAAQQALLAADTREGMRTGAVNGLVLVGPSYWAVAGAGNGDGMALTVTYTRRA